MGDKVGENLAALRAAVFFAILKNLRGLSHPWGVFKCPPPDTQQRAVGLMNALSFLLYIGNINLNIRLAILIYS